MQTFETVLKSIGLQNVVVDLLQALVFWIFDPPTRHRHQDVQKRKLGQVGLGDDYNFLFENLVLFERRLLQPVSLIRCFLCPIKSQYFSLVLPLLVRWVVRQTFRFFRKDCKIPDQNLGSIL